jgi:FtsP/CotA-like multicopper oxidase with cupredoxin domain
MMRRSAPVLRRWLPCLSALAVCLAPQAGAAVLDRCPRPAPGSMVEEPADRRSLNGRLELTLTAYNSPQTDGTVRHCYVDEQGHQSPNLRVSPGDDVVIHLKNAEEPRAGDVPMAMAIGPRAAAPPSCTASLSMSPIATNLHFHGMTMPAACHADDVLRTALQPGEQFDYRFRVPPDQPPALYWYHAHIHGFTQAQMRGGASGAIVVEGVERQKPRLAGLPERVFVIRDQDLIHKDAPPSPLEPRVPQVLVDRDGDAANTGTGFGKPAKDLSINYVPVPYPDYPPATLRGRGGERQLWRVLNASALT